MVVVPLRTDVQRDRTFPRYSMAVISGEFNENFHDIGATIIVND